MAFYRHQRRCCGSEAGLVALLRAAATRWAAYICILLFPFTPALAELKLTVAPATAAPTTAAAATARPAAASAGVKPAAAPTTAVSPEAKPVTAPTTAPSDVKPAAVTAPATAAPGTIARAVSLHDLGLDKGIDFSNLSGYKELFFPIPHRGFQAATLRLNLRSGAAFEGQRHLEVSAGGSILASLAITTADLARPIELPVAQSFAEDGFIRITLRYSGALTTDRCLSERVAGDYLSVKPESALELRLAPDALLDVRSAVSLLPRDVLLVLPERDLDKGEIAASLRAAAVLRHRGAAVTLATPAALPAGVAGTWSRGVVMVGKATDFQMVTQGVAAAEGLMVIPTQMGPAILVAGDDNAIAALPLLSTPWLPLADANALAVNLLNDGSKSQGEVSFEELHFPMQSSVLDERVQFDMTFTSDQLPKGMAVDGIRLDMALGSANDDIAVFAFLNGRLLGSRSAVGAVPTILTVAVPDGLVGRDNTLSLRIQRPPRSGSCVTPAPGEPVQLLPSSALQLAPAGGPPAEFFQLPQMMRGGIDIVLPNEPARIREALGYLIAVGVDLVPDDAQIAIRLEDKPTVGDRPFIVVSALEPVDTDPRLRFDQGKLAITRSDGKLLVDLANKEAMPTVAQLVRTANSGGLWLRPGKTMPTPRPDTTPIRLDRGNVAVIDKAGIALAFSTDRKEAASVSYLDIRSWKDVADEYRPWIVAGVWLLVAIVFVGALARSRRKKAS